MNRTTLKWMVPGIIELPGRVVATQLPMALLIMDAHSWARTRTVHLRSGALDPDFTREEREIQAARANALNRWIDGGCLGIVPFDVDINLYMRSAFEPSVVTSESLNVYLASVINISTIFPVEELDAPLFAFLNGELWLTDAPLLRAPRLCPGPTVPVVQTTADELRRIVDSRKGRREFMATGIAA